MPINKKIIVVGSTNTDMVVKTVRFPKPGETVLGGKFYMTQGGKGANQAVAAARLGGDVTFVSKLGNDVFGLEAIKNLKRENIDISAVEIDNNVSSGIALITVDQNAENNIVVAPGANAELTFPDKKALQKIIPANSIVLMQLEIPLRTIKEVCEYATSISAKVVLNPAPALPLDLGLLRHVDIITPNQEEALLLSGITVECDDSALKAAKSIHAMGPEVVVITLGSRGVFVYNGGDYYFVPAYTVEAVDTTAAGDIFNGALVTALATGQSIAAAVELGCKAAALSVTKIGAQQSAPTLKEISDFFCN